MELVKGVFEKEGKYIWHKGDSPWRMEGRFGEYISVLDLVKAVRFYEYTITLLNT